MNYFYIEYMLKELKRQELEECEKKRLLKDDDHVNPIKTGKLITNFKNKIKSWITSQVSHTRLPVTK